MKLAFLQRREINKQFGLTSPMPYPREFHLDPLRSTLQTSLLRRFLGKVEIPLGTKILFIGGGIGREIIQLKKHADFYAVNVDINTPLLERGNRYYMEHRIQCGCVAGDGMQLPFRDHAFDIVVLYESLHHMDDLYSCLQESFRIGKKVCIVDRRKCLVSQFGRSLHIIKPDFDGLYANELDMRCLKQWLTMLADTRLTHKEHHFFYLLVINRTIHNFISRYKLITNVDILCVKMINMVFGFLGNGIIIIMEKR